MAPDKNATRLSMTSRLTGICFLTATLLLTTAPAIHALWQDDPEITLAATQNDPRIDAVFEAVQFWNASLQELNISLQLGRIRRIPPPDIEESLKVMSAQDLASEDRLAYPTFMDNIETEILIVLTDAEMVSFAEYWEKKVKALIAVKSVRTPPLSLPNVARNVVAHELGHVLGLDHNDNEAMLMCGRPSTCGPDRFSSETSHFLPLTENEKALLSGIYENIH